MRPGCSPRRPPSIFFHIAAPLASSLSPPAAPFAHPRPPCPPTGHPQKLVYWLWIAAIFYLEQKIVIKQGVLLKPYELKVIGNEFLWRTKILHVVTHVLIDGFTLINLNCMFPRWGIKYPNGRRRAPVLRMSEETVVTTTSPPLSPLLFRPRPPPSLTRARPALRLDTHRNWCTGCGSRPSSISSRRSSSSRACCSSPTSSRSSGTSSSGGPRYSTSLPTSSSTVSP